MGSCSHDTFLNGLLKSDFSGCKSAILGSAVVPLDAIANVVAEHCNAIHLGNTLFERTLVNRERGVAGSPAFTINEARWVHLLQCFSHQIHSGDVVDSH